MIPEYESRFDNWEIRASVRNKPRRLLDGDGRALMFFPPESIPAIEHPLVLDRGPDFRARVLIHCLYNYLRFTTVLEQVAVLPVTSMLSLGRSGIELPPQMRADAYKITTDEAWHAQFCHEFMENVATNTGVLPGVAVEPAFAGLLDRIRSRFEPARRQLVDLTFAVVSETLISALLSEIPKDRRLPVAVRDVVSDHATDEGRHHAYFQSFLRIMWPQLRPDERRALGQLVPELITAFLWPDLGAVREALHESGLTRAQARLVVSEAYPPDAAIFDVSAAAQATVRGFTHVGALEDPATRDAFLRACLIHE